MNGEYTVIIVRYHKLWSITYVTPEKVILENYKAVKDPEHRQRILAKEQQKLDRAKKMGKTKIIVKVSLPARKLF